MQFVIGSLLLLWASTVSALAEDRVALVIGNSAYNHVGELANPTNDAEAIATSLKRLGFSSVVLKSDLDYSGFRRALGDFSRMADGADVALIYYAGHGIEVDKRNYLIPVDARLRDGRDADLEALPLDVVMSAVEGAKKLRLVVLDACRDNPFRARLARRGGTRSIGRGLARVDAPSNTLIAFAAREGTTAEDGRGRHSPYTSALLEHLETPGLEINFLFRRVRDAVLAETGGRQEPFTYGSLSSEAIYLQPGEVAKRPATPPPAVDKSEDDRVAALQARLKALEEQLRLRQEKAEETPKSTVTAPTEMTNAGGSTTNQSSRGDLSAIEAEIKRYDQAAQRGDDEAVHKLRVLRSQYLDAVRRSSSSVIVAYPSPPRYEATKSSSTATRVAPDNGALSAMEADIKRYEQAAQRGDDGAVHKLRVLRSQYLEAVSRASGAVVAANQSPSRYQPSTGSNTATRAAASSGDLSAMEAEIRHYERAVQLGDNDAVHKLRALRSQYLAAVSRDSAADAAALPTGAGQLTPGRMTELGLEFYFGQGRPKDRGQAVRWWREAANGGEPQAMFYIGLMYQRGEVAKDVRQAVHWYGRAIQGGVTSAFYYLAAAYDQGQGIARDQAEAARNMLQALKANDSVAKKEMMTNAAAWTYEFRRELQILLQREGAYAGAIDGQFGSGTARAVEAITR